MYVSFYFLQTKKEDVFLTLCRLKRKYKMDKMDNEDDEHICPICCGPMDKTDYRLFPCPCGFQV